MFIYALFKKEDRCLRRNLSSETCQPIDKLQLLSSSEEFQEKDVFFLNYPSSINAGDVCLQTGFLYVLM